MTAQAQDTTRLPDRFSELIRVAVKDGRALDRAAYFPYAHDWHRPASETFAGRRLPAPVCHVCTAGAVIAGTLGADTVDNLTPGMFDQNTADKLEALDGLRKGFPNCGVRLGLPPLDELLSADVLYHLRQRANFTGWTAYADHLDTLDAIADKLDALGY